MKRYQMTLIALLVVSFISEMTAQPYHIDTTVSGVQTLKVEGDLSVEQYGAGFGGDLKVVGDSHIGIGGVALGAMPGGVTGTYYGTQKIGEGLNVGEFLFEKTGDNDTGDFVVPLGMVGDWEGSLIKLDILTGPHDYDSGGAHFTILSKRIASQGGIIATDHAAVGGGRNVTIFGKNNGMIHLYLKFDAYHPWGGVRDFKLRVKISAIGSIQPTTVWEPFSAMTPIILGESLVTDQVTGDPMTHSLNAGSIVLNGDVSVPAGRTLTVDGSPVLTAAVASMFTPRGNVSNGASYAGGSAIASGNYAMANGASGTTASGDYSYASGISGTASGIGSKAHGIVAVASGAYSIANGFFVTASGTASDARGQSARAVGNFSTASGYMVEANSYGETAFGSANLKLFGTVNGWQSLDYLFHVGNGTSDSQRSDALTILKNGQTKLTNKDWKADFVVNPSSALNDPPSSADSGGEALVVEGHARLKGKVVIEVPQGDISMGIYE